MFQTICIKPNPHSFPTDVGFIAENLLYYKQVILIAGTETLPILLNNCDIDVLQELLSSKALRICFRENLLGVMTKTTPQGLSINDVSALSSDRLKVDQMLFDGLFQATGRRGHSKRMAQKLLPLVEPISYEENICDMVRSDLTEQSYTKSTIIDTIKFYNPNIEISPNQLHYKWKKAADGFIFETNLNYAEINKQIPNNPDQQLINPTSLILNILETRGDMHLASSLNSEIATTGLNTSLMKIKFKDIYERTTNNLDNIFQFNDFALEDGFAIREAINSGDKSFKEFMQILEKADKFKEWLENMGDDKNIIKEYHRAVTKQTWVDKLPSKAVRWSFFTGAGLALDFAFAGGLGTAIGTGLSVGDAFLLDKLLKGWRPNAFVETELKSFIQK